MPNLSRTRLGVFLTVMVWAAFAVPANAYIDPVSTSVVFQGLIAALAAAGTGLAMFWTRITSFFQRHGGTSGDDTVGPTDEATAATREPAGHDQV